MQRKQSKNAKITLSILLCLLGIILISYSYFEGIKNNVFNDRNIRLLEQQVLITELIYEEDNSLDNTIVDLTDQNIKDTDTKDNYIGFLEVPDVNIKRGFVSLDSKYNTIGYNVMLVKGSTMPDVKDGNLILAAHRGNSPVSFFENLYKLKEDALAKVSYNGKTYTYKLVNRYYEAKDGVLTIKRNADATCLTLITCTRDDKTTQTVFSFELISID